MSVDPKVVHFPYTLPVAGEGAPFGERLYANYSASLSGQVVVVQYQSGSDWLYLQEFTANNVEYTIAFMGLNSAWVHAGVNTVRAVSGACVSSPASFTVLNDRTALRSDLALYAMVALAWVAFFLVGKWVRFGIFLAVALSLYLILAPFTGQRYDMYFLASSGIRMLQHVNPFDPGNPPIYPSALKWAYPPMYAVYSAISYLAYQVLTGTKVPTVGSLTWPGYATAPDDVWEAIVPQSLPVLALLLKLPMIVSALATGLLLRRMTGKESVAVSWLVNPLVILVAAIWGQLDPIAALLALASVYYYGKNKPYHAYFLASLGAAVKVWPILLLALFLAGSLKRDGGLKAIKPLVAVLPALAGTVGLYAIFGNLLENLLVFVYARGVPTYAGQFSVNGLTWQELLVALGSPPIPLFLILGIPLYLSILVHVYRSGDDDVVKWTVVSILIFYLTYNYVNPQYFCWILPFLILQGRRVATWVFTALPLVYIALAYNIFYFISPVLLFHEFSTGASIVEQLKLASFYQSTGEYIVVTAVVPTLAYLLLLSRSSHQTPRFGEISPEG